MLLAGIAAAVAAVSLVAGAGAATNPDLTRSLRGGGLVLVLRHAHTDQSKQDEDPVVVADCATQRNLSAQGRADARAIGRGVRRLNLPIGKVLSSAYCRTLETARLAFGRATVSPALLNTIASAHDARWQRQIAAAKRLIGTKPARGTLTVLVTHGILVTEATGQTLEEGEIIVFRPLGRSRFRVVGRVLPGQWAGLRTTSASSARRPTVREFPVPAGTHPHDVAPAPDGTVWYTAQLTGARPARPTHREDDAHPARRRLGAARRDRRARRRAVDHRWRPQRDRSRRPGHARRFALAVARQRRQCEPQHGDLRSGGSPLVHRTERVLRKARSGKR